MTHADAQSAPVILQQIAELHAMVAGWRQAGDTMALVPTMGALHAGHLALVREAQRHAQRVVVSIFVNPAQFAPTEDLVRYPRQLEADRAALAGVGADAIWAPDVATMYPPGFATRVVPDGAALGLEADFRPHFFAGVATVCCKLFTQVAPDIAVFGEKDWQQLAVVRQIVRDLNLPLSIVGLPTVRATDGLALSSRNSYLSAQERQAASALYAELRQVAVAISARISPDTACATASAALVERGWRVDYCVARDAATLGPLALPKAGRLLVAAWLGTTRLIDNVGI
jgi:pantoate--beta-alanine ligase